MMNITNCIKEFIKKEILNTREEVFEDLHLIESGILDSISLMKLLTYIECEFSVQFDERDFDIEKFSTINKISAIIEEKQNNCA